MKQIRLLFTISLMLLIMLSWSSARGQNGGPYLEGGVFVSAGDYTKLQQPVLFEHSLGQIAFTHSTEGDIQLEQGVLHNFTPAAKPPKPPDRPNDTTGLDNQKLLCHIFPNPCNAVLRVETPENGSMLIYKVLSSTGTIFLQGSIAAGAQYIPTHSLPTGLYVLILESPDGANAVKRFIKE